MLAHDFTRTPRVPVPTVAAALAITVALLSTGSAIADKGKWTTHQDWSGGDPGKYAIDLLLLPGDGTTYHSRILYFSGEHQDVLKGEVRGWNPGNDDCEAATNTGFTVLGAPSSSAGYELYCGGHAALATGDYLLSGGTVLGGGYFGEHKSGRYVRSSGSGAGSWSSISQSMYDGRWYNSIVALRDGRALTLSGHRFPHLRVFGGKRNGGAPSTPEADSVLRFGSELPSGIWDASVKPIAATGDIRPGPRERLSGVSMDRVSGVQGHMYFGGLGASDALDEAWLLTREPDETQSDYAYRWARILPTTRPAKRSDHSAIVVDNSMMLVFGGRNYDGSARGDLWRLQKRGNNFLWQELFVSGTPPSARYGHAAIYDELTISSTLVRRMLVFGGITGDGQSLANDKVYELRLDLSNLSNSTWYERTPADLGDGTPSARYWHSMHADPLSRNITVNQVTKYGHSAALFGGKTGASSYSSELWQLWMFDDGTFGWKKVTPSGTAPTARALHAAAYDRTLIGDLQ